MRTITDEQRRARLGRPAGPGRARRVRRGGRRVGGLPARHRGAHRLPVRGRACRRDASRTSAGRSTRTARSSSSSRCDAPCSPSRATCCPRCGGAPPAASPSSCSARLAREVEAHGIATRGDVWLDADDRDRARRARRGARRPRPSCASRSRRWPGGWRCRPGSPTAPTSPIAPRVLSTLAATGKIVRGEQRGRLAHLAPTVDAHRGLAGRGGRPEDPADGLPRAGPPLAAPLRSGHRVRPRLVARRDQGRRTPRAGATSTRWRCRSPRAPATCCPTTSTTSPNRSRGPPCCRCSTRPRWAGRSATFYLDPSRPALPVRHQRQRRQHRLVVRPRRGLLGAGPGRRRRGRPGGDPGSEALAALQVEAERLTAWLDGAKVSTVYTSPQMRSAQAP